MVWARNEGVSCPFPVVGGWEWRHFTIEYYTDLWKTHKMTASIDIYSQTRLFVKVYKRLSAGVFGTIYYSPENVVLEGGIFLCDGGCRFYYGDE